MPRKLESDGGIFAIKHISPIELFFFYFLKKFFFVLFCLYLVYMKTIQALLVFAMIAISSISYSTDMTMAEKTDINEEVTLGGNFDLIVIGNDLLADEGLVVLSSGSLALVPLDLMLVPLSLGESILLPDIGINLGITYFTTIKRPLILNSIYVESFDFEPDLVV